LLKLGKDLIDMTIINLENGDFSIDNNIVIGRDKSYFDILELVPQNRTWDIGNGYKWIYFENVDIENLIFYVNVCFHNNRLFCIDFGFVTEQEKKLSWDDWSEKEELKRKDIYEEWLTEKIGEKRTYSWGKIGASYDPRGGVSSMVINYVNENKPTENGKF